MFCTNCGKELLDDANFCSGCGIKIRTIEVQPTKVLCIDESIVKSVNDFSNTSVEVHSPAIPYFKPDTNSKKLLTGSILITALLLISSALIYFLAPFLNEYQARQQREEQQDELAYIALTHLGNRSYGSNDIDTVQYSGALGNLSSAILNPDEIVSRNGEKITNKEICFKYLEAYFDETSREYTKGFSTLVFGFDYLEETDVDYFYNGTKVNGNEVRSYAEDIMFRDHISLTTLLINEMDETICLNVSIKLKLAEDGYLSVDDVYSELYDFVLWGKPIITIDEDILADEPTYEDIANDIAGSFSGERVYYQDLTTAGKVVFTYLMPQYLYQFAENEGIDLYFAYSSTYGELWNKILHSDIFSTVIE